MGEYCFYCKNSQCFYGYVVLNIKRVKFSKLNNNQFLLKLNVTLVNVDVMERLQKVIHKIRRPIAI